MTRPTRQHSRKSAIEPVFSGPHLCRVGGVKLRISAPPVDGKANAELGKVIAAATGVRLRDVHVVRGERSRTKVVRVDRLTSTEVAARLAAAQGRDVATLRTR